MEIKISINSCGPALDRIEKHLKRLETMMTASQDQMDAIVAALTEVSDNIATEMAALKQAVIDAGVTVDFTNAEAAVQRLDSLTTAVESGEVPPVTP